jgi:anti-sigma B factor antagonist
VSLSIETRRRDERESVIALHGEFDYATAQEVRGAISAVLGPRDIDVIVVDLAGVTFLDSTGVGTLVVARRICADFNVEFRVSDPNPFISKLFTVVGVAEILGVPTASGFGPRLPRPRTIPARTRVA